MQCTLMCKSLYVVTNYVRRWRRSFNRHVVVIMAKGIAMHRTILCQERTFVSFLFLRIFRYALCRLSSYLTNLFRLQILCKIEINMNIIAYCELLRIWKAAILIFRLLKASFNTLNAEINLCYILR